MTQLYKILTLGLLVAVFGCKNSENNTQDSAEDHRIVISKEQFITNNMALGKIKVETFPETVKVNGMIDVPPENKASVNAITEFRP